MSEGHKTAKVNGHTVYLSGPFKGDKRNHGREHYTYYDPKTGHRGSVNKARIDYEKKTGHEVAKGKDVDHKDGNRNNDSPGNLRAISKSANVAKGNKERHHKKHSTAKKAPAKKTAAKKRKS